MNILVYASPENKAGMRIIQVIGSAAFHQNLEIYPSMETLSNRLKKPLHSDIIGIFMPEDFKDLLNLVSIQPLFRNMRIILILPDREEATISAGHALGPRYLSYSDCDLRDVAAVMDKILLSQCQVGSQLYA